MNTNYPTSQLAHVLVPSNIVAMMSGCRQISRHGDTVTAHYVDGSEESITWPAGNILETDNFFSLLRFIQEKARAIEEEQEAGDHHQLRETQP